MARVQDHSEETKAVPVSPAENTPPDSLRDTGDGFHPLSSAQEHIWLLEQEAPGASRHSLPTLVQLRGPLNIAALDRSLNTLLTRHEALRTRFAVLEDQSVQIVDEQATLRLNLLDLSSNARPDRETEAGRIVQQEINRPFKLTSNRLFRATLLKLQPEDHLLLVNTHRIVCDETLRRILLRELKDVYARLAPGEQPRLAEFPITHALAQRDSFHHEFAKVLLAASPSPSAGCPSALGENSPKSFAHSALEPSTETGAAGSSPSPRGEGRGEGDRRVLVPGNVHTEAATRDHQPEITEKPPQDAAKSSYTQSPTAPLSFSQKRAWLLQKLEPDQTVYHRAAAISIEGPLDESALQQAFNQVVRRHEILRTVFPERGGGPIQQVLSPVPLQIRRVDLQTDPSERGQPCPRPLQLSERLLELARAETAHPFPLSEAHALRATLVRLDPQQHVLLLVAHEIALDSTSFSLLFQELARHYGAAVDVAGQAAPYRDFAHWQLERSRTHDWAEHATFWKRQLAGAPALLELPTDHARPAAQTYRAGDVSRLLDAGQTKTLKQLSLRLGVNESVLLLATIQVLLQRYSRQDDLVVGVTSETRDPREFERAIGNFSNLVPFRARIESQTRFSDLAAQLRHTSETVARHQEFPFQALVEELRPAREQSFHPLCQIAFTHSSSPRPVATDGVNLRLLDLPQGTTRFDLHFHATDTADGLTLRLEFARDLFEPDTAARMLEHWRTLLDALVAAPDSPIAKLPILPAHERKLLLEDWTNTQADYPADKTLTQLFDEQAQKTPDAEALVCGTERLTYSQLRARALVIAEHLRGLGVAPGSLVAVCQERTSEMVAGILGTLFAGAAYVPMDPAYPAERVAFMLEDTQARVVLTQRSLRDSLPTTNAWILCVEDLRLTGANLQPSTFNFQPFASPSDVAYIIYTSGSTGKPKGVQLEHRNAVAMVSWARSVFTAEEISGVLASTSICFDLSIFELFVPLCSGGKVILAKNALALPALPAAGEVKMINTVPSAIRELLRVKGVPHSVVVINLAGEPLPTALVDRIHGETSARKVYDLYGPTETTTYSTYTLRKPGKPATIGRPLSNEQVYLLDSCLQPVPIGVPGELYIGGAGVTRGYLNRPDLTAERYLPDPFRAGGRLYKTGDLARWRNDGNLEFLGRLDYQVKIRGFRIELGEIEAALKKLPGIQEAIVLAREDKPGDLRLVAYVVATRARTDESTPAIDSLRASLRRSLPEFMVPAVFVFLDALPLTPNGKVDRKALPAPEPGRTATAEFIEPRTPCETDVAAIWRDVLGIEKVGVRDNFFDLGGHSLLGIQVISRIREAFGIEVPLFSLFDTPTIEALAAGIESHRWPAIRSENPVLRPVPRTAPLPVSFVQERLWFLDQLAPDSDAYNVPAALRLKGPLNAQAMKRALNEIIRRHEALRTTFKYQDGNLTQIIAPSLEIEIVQEDPIGDNGIAASNGADAREARAREFVDALARKPFDLARGPLLRAGLIRLADEEHVFAIVLHHSISDGWSLGVLFRELQTLYCGGTLPALPVQYADYASWKRQCMQGSALQRELDYWKSRLAGAPAALDLPVDTTDLDKPALKASRCSLELRHPLRDGPSSPLREGGTPFMTLAAALAISLHRWTGQHDLVLGTVVAGRTRSEVENLIGCFMNFLPLRLKLRGTETGAEVLSSTRETILEAQAHQECPFEKMVEAINPERRLNQNPLYNVALVLQNFPAKAFAPDTIRARPYPVSLQDALLDLRFEARETEQGLSLVCEYRSELFARETIQGFLTACEATLGVLLTAPETPLKDFPAPVHQEASTAGRKRQTLAITSTFTAEPLAEPLRYWLKDLGSRASIEFAPYNQVFQQLLDPASLLGRNQSGMNVILLRLEDWLRQDEAARSGNPQETKGVERNVKELALALRSAAERGSTPWLLCLCPPSPALADDPAQAQLFARLESSLADELARINSVYVLTQAELARWYPVSDYYDASGDELGHVPYTPLFFTSLATAIVRKFHALNRPAFKVIALDCDNTLWAGVCGEDGARGIRLDWPFAALQQFMRAQHDAGRLLCLCSKNNQEDVRDVFEQRLDMSLRWENLAASRLNWRPKSENLKSLAQELGLGLDSFVFIDDNPVECAEVEANCPDVLVLQLPEDPALIPAFLEHCWVFDHLKLTTEDLGRAQMYRQNQKREEFRARSLSLTEFLAGLDLRIQLEPLSNSDPAFAQRLPRVAQLTQRTNQFNFTTRRRTESDLQKLMLSAEIMTVSVTDRFGDYGLAGAIIFSPKNSALDVDTFLLSCRVLGRGVEHRMLSRLGELACERHLNWVDIHFNTSQKNRPALDFLETVGASFRQPLNGGYLFRFPAAFAAEVTFNPQSEADSPGKAHGQNGENRPQPLINASRADQTGTIHASRITHHASPAAKFIRCRQIALEARDPAQIHQRIEAKSIVRARNRAGYAAPRPGLESQLCALWQKLLHVEPIGVHDNFFELGGHSLLAVRLFAEVEKLTGRKLPLVTLFQSPTIRQLARALDEGGAATARSLLVPLQPHGSKPPLFLIHGAGGDILWGYANLVAHLPADQPLYGIRSSGHAGRGEAERIEDMAATYVKEIQRLQPHGPYYLGGYCFGGNVACEMARQLSAAGESIGLLVLFDASPANVGYEKISWWKPSWGLRFLRNFYYWLRDFAALPSRDRRRFFGRKFRALGRRFLGQQPGSSVDLEEVIDPAHFPENELRLWRIHLQALVDHVDKEYAGEILLLRTRGQPLFCSLADDFCWGKLVKTGVKVRRVPGSHESIFVEPNVRVLAKELQHALAHERSADASSARTSLQPTVL